MTNRIAAIIACFIATLTTAYSQEWPHFIKDKTYREKVEKRFNQRKQTFGDKYIKQISILSNSHEIEALWFLYAYMPTADITDYPFSFHLENIRASFRARKEMNWGPDVPEILFRHFVLPVRVNNEALDNFRSIYYEELKERVKGLGMKDAILEVNHWCHEHVTYQPSDARTLSPLAAIKTAKGRCGEESTLTVAALRTIGIPARQVYTPRWAHTDDNHAWVEAWADGQWFFLGACEPEPVLNLGWFNQPATRAMLMHTRVFGDYEGPEEVMLRTNNFTEINLIGNYADTRKVNFTIVDVNGKKVEGARVDFKIYNYAEFCTVATKYSDHDGHTSLTAGRGDMIVWASKNGWMGYEKIDFDSDNDITIRLTLNEKNIVGKTDSLDIKAPKGKETNIHISEAAREKNRARLQYEDSLRHTYENTFFSEDKAKSISERFWKFIVKSRGNHKVITQFINDNIAQEERVFQLLNSLSDKDLGDITAEILNDNLLAQSDEVSPRVENEMITRPFKQVFEKAFTEKQVEKFRSNPEELAKWTKENISVRDDENALHIAQTALGVWESRLADRRSRDIFFVDMARSIGIRARKDIVTGKIQYMKDGDWRDADFNGNDEQSDKKTKKHMGESPKGRLVITNQSAMANPKYYSHFTISKIEDGTTLLMNFEEQLSADDEGTTWENTFKDGITLDAGVYMLTTGTRLANGNTLTTNRFFRIEKDKETDVILSLRENRNSVSVIGNFDSESPIIVNGEQTTILKQTGRGYYMLGIIAPLEEPSNHAMRDIAKLSAELQRRGRPMIIIRPTEEKSKLQSIDYVQALPEKTIFAADIDDNIKKAICKEMKLANDRQLPIFIIADTFNRIVFCQQGYTIGLGEQIADILKKL